MSRHAKTDKIIEAASAALAKHRPMTGKRLEELERPKAKERQGTRTDLQPSVKFTEGMRGQTRDIGITVEPLLAARKTLLITYQKCCRDPRLAKSLAMQLACLASARLATGQHRPMTVQAHGQTGPGKNTSVNFTEVLPRPADVLKARLVAEVEARMDMDALADIRQVEGAERERVRHALLSMEGGAA